MMKISTALTALLFTCIHAAALELGAPFADHAVLQRQQPVPIWGWSKPGTEVTVTFAGQSQSAQAAENGKWSATLAPLEASAEGRELTIAEKGGESRTLKDILLGEVWMASGQSNMQWIAGKCSVANLLKKTLANGGKPPIRELTIHEEVKVPIGILNCSFSQTSIESWMFNGRLSPVIPYALRGAIWNQGYANIHGGLKYYQNLHNLIRGWRMKWNHPTLPVYFHQFYCPGSAPGGDTKSFPSSEPMSEMRLGAWLARDIPHTGMASQIDIAGAIHYYQKALPGQRLALHALKNQYAKPFSLGLSQSTSFVVPLYSLRRT